MRPDRSPVECQGFFFPASGDVGVTALEPPFGLICELLDGSQHANLPNQESSGRPWDARAESAARPTIDLGAENGEVGIVFPIRLVETRDCEGQPETRKFQGAVTSLCQNVLYKLSVNAREDHKHRRKKGAGPLTLP